MRLQAIATHADLAEWRWQREFMLSLGCELLRTLGYPHGQRLGPDVVELVGQLREWPQTGAPTSGRN